MIESILDVLSALAAAVIIVKTIDILGHMNRYTHHGLRVAIILLCSGAFTRAADLFMASAVPDLSATMLAGGICLFILYDRRCTDCPRISQMQRQGTNEERRS